MRLFEIGVAVFGLASAGWAGDAFDGDWKLNLEKSNFGTRGKAKDGRVLMETVDQGYNHLTEIVFVDGLSLRFANRVRFDGEPENGTLDNHLIRYVSKQVVPNSFDVEISDTDTGRVVRTVHAEVAPQSRVLTMSWTDPQSSTAALKLIYERAPQGPLLEIGKTVEQSFGPGATHEYRVKLQAGEYCEGKVSQKGGTVNIAAYGPDDAKIRGFGGPATGDKQFAFEAPTAGLYHVILRSAVSPAESYTITLDKVTKLDERLQRQPRKERYIGKRIAALRKDVESGNAGAVAAFWQEVERVGAPVIEALDDSDNLVTFLWRASKETRNVLILWFPYAAARPDDFQMVRLGNTDVWYRTVKIRKGARFAYQLSPNDPLIFDELAGPQRSATAQADPLNPHHWFEGPGATKFEYLSYVEMPDAKPQPYIAKRPGVPAGSVEKKKIKSELLDNERELSVYLPVGYRREGPPNALLVVFDESAYLTNVPTPVILDNLLSEKKIPPMVAVLIANPSQETRNRELPPNPKFADFLNNELVTWVRANYNVTKDPSKVVVAGSSYGGIASVYAGLRHPETFGNILCQSGSFWWSAQKPAPYAEPNYLAKEFIKSPKLPLKFYMDAGSFEVDTNGGGGAILEPSRHMRDVLLAKGYELDYQENIGGHDYLSWRGSLADGLIALVGLSK
jgi:enterochelin esterase-like enzyme